jgi:hypothetical protein
MSVEGILKMVGWLLTQLPVGLYPLAQCYTEAFLLGCVDFLPTQVWSQRKDYHISEKHQSGVL